MQFEHRTIHLIDIENLVGSRCPSAPEAERARQWYRPQLVRDGDHVVVACSHRAFASVAWAWPRARHRIRSGVDGADLALLEVIEQERVAERYTSAVIASGDGIFAEAVARLGANGVDVTVVARPGTLARRLQVAARRVRWTPLSSAWTPEPQEAA